jgi:NTP pyrophosphatase (non-canonical NTP hydrolase)
MKSIMRGINHGSRQINLRGAKVERQVCGMKGGRKAVTPGLDRLSTMLRIQASFAKRYFDIGKMQQAEREKWIKEMCLCIAVESAELLDEVNWKHWKKTQKAMDLEQARFELADLFCFTLNVAMLLGMDAEAIFQYYMRKAEINRERQACGY